jgi:putative IMPACT (imprinted ancient) family translation regulator
MAKLRKQHFDATHHCSAFREGLPVTAFGSSDDGEPGGTAGLPMLKILEGECLTDVLTVVIRWFGGTKLGTGGLVRAYSDAVRGVVDQARNQGLLEEAILFRRGVISVPMEDAHLPFIVLGAFPEVLVEGQDFEEGIANLRFSIVPGREALLDQAWQERSRGGRITWSV